MSNNVAFVFISIFALIFTGCAKDKNPVQELALIGPGFLDMPIIEGSSIPDNCMYDSIFTASKMPTQKACVIFPLKSKGVNGKNWDRDYLQNLAKVGWKYSYGEGNVYFLEKPIENSNCPETLAMIGWLHGSNDEVKKAMEFGNYSNVENQLYIFAQSDEFNVCGDDRNVK